MTGPYTDTGVITGITRLKNTRLGNPRYEVALDNGQWYHTKANSSIAADISNSEWMEGARVQLVLTKRYQIDDIKVV
ncbi:MAG TPA: hypothetical protein VFK47_15540 [Ktedonobacteraceae bacterium]|nr:hypothetical protein [Ktedonobacteraceae bacterium]